MYQAVFFDAFNTLIGAHWPGKATSRRLPLQHVMERRLGRLDANWQAAYGRARSDEGGANWLQRVMAGIADHSGVSSKPPFALWHKRNEASLKRWMSVYDDTLVALPKLSETCKLGIISNAWPYLEPVLQWLGIWEYFQSVIISAQVGLSKPHSAIYELALRSLHLKPEQAIFVDDMPQNVAAAESVGLRGLWLVRPGGSSPKVPRAYENLTRIYSLEHIIPMVGQA